MALTFVEQDQKVNDDTFIRRVAQAAVKHALVVMIESAATGGHDLRAAFAQRVLYAPVETADTMARGIVTNTAVVSLDSGDPSDAQLSDIVMAQWDAYSNYDPTA